jgi:hypothetical protein
VEDWKITIPSYDMLPTVPFSFDEVYWEAYWKVVNEPTKVVHSVIQKLEHEIKMKKMADQKHKLEKDRAERLQAEKKQEELRLRKRKKIIESPTQSPIPSSPESLFSKDEHRQEKRRNEPPTQSPTSKRRIMESPSPSPSAENKTENAQEELLNPPPVRLHFLFFTQCMVINF